MKKFGIFAVLILLAVLVVACGGKDEAPAADVPEVIVDTSAFEEALAQLTGAIEALDAKVESLDAGEVAADVAPAAETGGGADITFDENGFMITTYVDNEGRVLTCGLAAVINDGAPIYQIALDKKGELKENSQGYPVLQPAPNLFLDEEYVCVETSPIKVDGGNAFRLQYAQFDDVLEEWRGLEGDWFRCCFVDFDDVEREAYAAP
jgi:hypothetical protein